MSCCLRVYGYRDYNRRCKFLERLFVVGKLDGDVLNKYTIYNIKRMLWFMETDKHDIQVRAAKKIVQVLRQHLLVRPKSTSFTKLTSTGKIPISLMWDSRSLHHIPLRKIFTKTSNLNLLPNAIQSSMNKIMIVRKLTDPIYNIIFNFTKVCKDPSMSMGPGKTCVCHKYDNIYKQKINNKYECVLTGDLSIIEHIKVRQLLDFGPRFRSWIKSDTKCRLLDCINECAFTLSHKFDIDISQFKPWVAQVKQQVLQTFHQILNSKYQQFNSHDNVVIDGDIKMRLRALHKHFVMVPVDKAANNVAVICRKYYTQQLVRELEKKDGAYELVTQDQTEQTILTSHATFLKPYGMQAPLKCNTLPYLYWLPKLHKTPVSSRYIAGSSKCSTTRLSKNLSLILTHVMSELRAKDDENIIRTGIRRFFIVNGYEEVASFTDKWHQTFKFPNQTQHLYTGDFSTMYTAIPHNDLIARIDKVIDETWHWAHMRTKKPIDMIQLDVTDKHQLKFIFTDRTRHATSKTIYSRDQVKLMIKFLVTNTYSKNGEYLCRQTVGIPMGTNCAPSLANLYLYSYECEFIDRLVANQEIEHAKLCHMTFRLIDDVLSIDNPIYQHYATLSIGQGGIYPDELLLNNTSISSSEVRFLGMTLQYDNRELVVSVYDKRLDFSFQVRRYPNMASLIPSNIPYGVFIGQLHRYYRICSKPTTFLQQAKLLGQTLINQGCLRTRLQRTFSSFLSKLAKLRWKGVKPIQLIHGFLDKRGASSI
jgi:hypothetical protein